MDNFKKTTKSTIKNRVNLGISFARAYINSSFNNTIITITDIRGNTLAYSSAGTVGFKGSRKSSPFAASKAAKVIVDNILAMGIKNVDIFISGPGPGRDSAIRAFDIQGLIVNSLTDVTPIPHNGCKPPKQRRN
jgi:small subunit ribosomal protein S11